MEKKKKFQRLNQMLLPKVESSPVGKATAELDASRNPEAFLKKMKNPSWKNLKGVAF